jgi:murein DD-endopeptidase MepM/ murein hydrolase activator NlpD
MPEPRLTRLGAQGVVLPFFSGDGSKVLYYDQPAPNQGGTWSIDPTAPEPRRERPLWGFLESRDTLLATPRPARRDTYVVHLPSGREWTLPTVNTTVFSADGTVVAYTASGIGQPGGPPAGPGQGFVGRAPPFAPTAITVAGADGQNARRIQLPINGSVVDWLPAPDGPNNARLLLTGRRAEPDDPSLWAYDLRDGGMLELARSKRLTGLMASPDGTWVAHVAMWNPDPGDNGLWLTRADGSQRRRVALVGSYRWTADNRLLVVPARTRADDGHQIWEVQPASGAARRLIDPQQLRLRIANHDWDVTPDGQQVVFVSADDKSLWHLTLPNGMLARDGAVPPELAGPAPGGTGGKPYRLPVPTPPGPSTWYIAQWYGVTTGGYRGRNSTYSQGQGIHFGIDFATACGTPVVAVAPGRVIAVDGDYGSPPHNVVIQLYDGNIAMYGHLVERSRHVQPGQAVEAGQVVGNTGDSIFPYNCTRNPHLHLEIRKQGRAVATNPVAYFDVNWDDLSLGWWPGPRFERNLDDPRRNQFLDEQPDISFGGPIITNFGRPWPP